MIGIPQLECPPAIRHRQFLNIIWRAPRTWIGENADPMDGAPVLPYRLVLSS
jgi:hypothetical protein